ncbi:serine hydrolase domain-containing protein [Oceanobacillus salinisoli]|uniref:serine hydrolase domain-containing protein n=1 Tax=Oceanobacillus salinisoli TaxID=2678611 RepID=UPI0012E14128|nr:serine hydrolase [Oceanobacillus salinisoli]
MEFHRIDRIFRNYIENEFFSGGVCHITIDGETVFHKGYGKANRIKKTPCEKHTIFDIASVTKLVTTTILLKIISEGSLSLSTRLGECLPRISKNTPLAQITIYELLTHSSGLIAWYPFYAEKDDRDFFSIIERIDIYHDLDEKVVYSDLNYMLLGEILKEYFQSSLESIVNKQVVEPLGLETLSYHPIEKELTAATEYGNRIEKEMCRERGISFFNWRRGDLPISGEPNDGNAYYFFNGESGHAGLFSNVKDITKIGELYLKGGVLNGEQLILESVVNGALTKQVGNRGLGWEKSAIYPEGFGHTGFTGTALWIEPKRKISVGLFTNRLHVTQPRNINPFRREIFSAIHSEIKN